LIFSKRRIVARTYRHLRLAEQDQIMRLRDAPVPVGKIATELGRHPATIYRELQSDFFMMTMRISGAISGVWHVANRLLAGSEHAEIRPWHDELFL
jgi:hypothetical protein